MDLKFERGSEVGRVQRAMPAELYNKLHLLFARTAGEHMFVPIRAMQYLAAIDREEIVFVDGAGPRHIEISWCEFQVRERQGLHSPVAYTCVYYDEKGHQIMNRLQSEFFKALELIEGRQPKPASGTVSKLSPD